MRSLVAVPLLSAALLAGSVASGSAADMPVPALPPQAVAPYSPPPYSWTGFYLGANAGWAWTQVSESLTAAAATGTLTGTTNGFLGGGQAGFNWQILVPLVIGLEADIQDVTEDGTMHGALGAASITSGPKGSYFGTIRGRIGFAYDRLLFYATAGGAYGESSYSGSLSTRGIFSTSATYSTWTAGGGIEAALGGHFTMKFEYLYIGTPSTLPLVPTATAVTGTATTNIARAGLNYRF